jgi:hypothetical protein
VRQEDLVLRRSAFDLGNRIIEGSVIIVFIIISVAMKHDVGCSDDGCGT